MPCQSEPVSGFAATALSRIDELGKSQVAVALETNGFPLSNRKFVLTTAYTVH